MKRVQWWSAIAVLGDTIAIPVDEELKDFTGFSVSPRHSLGVEKLTVHPDIEDTF